MSLFGSIDQANNAPKYAVDGGRGNSSNGSSSFGSIMFGVDAAEQQVPGNPKGGHAGWNLVKRGTGPVESIELVSGGTDYSSNGFVVFYTEDSGVVAANAAYTVNTTSNTIDSVTLISGGSGYITTPTATAANANSANAAVFSVVMGGRANRTQVETLVAMGSMTGDGSDDALFADS